MHTERSRSLLAGLFALVGLVAVHSSVHASPTVKPGEPGEPKAVRSAETPPGVECSAAVDADELAQASASAEPNPYYCICCDATGNGSCCAKC